MIRKTYGPVWIGDCNHIRDNSELCCAMNIIQYIDVQRMRRLSQIGIELQLRKLKKVEPPMENISGYDIRKFGITY